MCFIQRHDVTGRRYFCPDHRIGYLAAERFRHRLECDTGRRTGVSYWRGPSGRYSGGVEYRLERDGGVYSRHYHQLAAG